MDLITEELIVLEPEAIEILLDKTFARHSSPDSLAELLCYVKESIDEAHTPKRLAEASRFVDQIMQTIFCRYSPAARGAYGSYVERLRGETVPAEEAA